MELRKPATIAEFLDAASRFLLRHEAEHGLMLGIAVDPVSPPIDAYWALVMHDGEIVGAVLRTAVKLVVSREDHPGAMALLARDAIAQPLRPSVTAVLGPPASVDAFAAAIPGMWQEGRAARIYELRSVVPLRVVVGVRRLSRPSDREVLAEWTSAFSGEAINESLSRAAALASVDRRIAHAALHVWEVEGRLTATASVAGPTPHGVRVSAVYTPPELRGQGYASALVASLSQHLLDVGRAFVFLYTDLANPISNRIYQRIGYRPVADVRELCLDRAVGIT